MTTAASLTPAQLARLLRAGGVRVAPGALEGFLVAWQEQGITERDATGRWRLTAKGRTKFGLLAAIEGPR